MRIQLFLPLILVFVVLIVVGVVVLTPTQAPDSLRDGSQEELSSPTQVTTTDGTKQGSSLINPGEAERGAGYLDPATAEVTVLDATTGLDGQAGLDGLITSASSEKIEDATSASLATNVGQGTEVQTDRIQGMVTNSKRTPLAGVTLTVAGLPPITTDPTGTFAFTGLAEPMVTLTATLAGYNQVIKEIPAGSTNVVIMMVAEGALAGQVLDQFDAPIASAQVTLQAEQGIWIKNLTADGQGRFEVAEAPPGSISAQATMTGYTDQGEGTKTVTMPLSEPVLLRLKQPSFSISGRVYQQDSIAGVPGFHMAARLEDGQENPQTKTIQTDGAGVYIFEDMKLGTYIISSLAQQNTHLNLTIPIDQDFKNVRVNERDVKNVDFIAVPGLTVSGTVQTQGGQPVSGAEVTIAHLLSSRTVSSSDGRFTLTNVPTFSQGYNTLPHDFTLQLLATHPQYGSGQSDPLASGGEPVIANIIIQMFESCSLAGAIQDTQGNPIPDASIQLQDTVQGKLLETVSDGGGTFQFDQVPSVRQIPGQFRGTHILSVQKEGYEKKQQELVMQPGETKSIIIKLSGGDLIQGYVSDTNRRPLGGVKVSTYLPDGGKTIVYSDDGGIYRLPSLPLGQYDLQFRLDSNPPLSAFLYGVETGNTGANAVLIHQEWISQGTVFDADTNQPINQYMISIEGIPAENPNRKFTFTKPINSPDGKFQLVYNEPGLYNYRFTAPNYHPFNGSVRIDQTTIRSQILNAWLKPLESMGGLSGQFQSQEGYLLVGINVLGIGSFPSNGNQFQIERLPSGTHDLLFFVQEPASGLIKQLGVLSSVPIQANQNFDIGLITPQRLTVRFRD